MSMDKVDDTAGRHDVLIINSDHKLGLTLAGARSLLQYLGASGIATPKQEAIAKTWAEIYLVPGPAAHDAFVIGPYKGESPVFKEAVLRMTDTPEPIPFGLETITTRWTLQFLGCLLTEPSGPFCARLKSNWLILPEFFHRPHAGMPPHKEVPADEQPEEKAKKGKTNIGVGVRVEEW